MSDGAALPRVRAPRVLGLLAGAGVASAAIAVLVVTADSTSVPEAATGKPLPAAVSPAEMVERSGARIAQLDVTGGGGLLDLRYQAVDAGAAGAIHDPETPPAIVDERTGFVIDSLFMGHAHSGRTRAGSIYYLVFNNPGNIVRPGDRVSVVLGDARLEHVRVR